MRAIRRILTPSLWLHPLRWGLALGCLGTLALATACGSSPKQADVTLPKAPQIFSSAAPFVTFALTPATQSSEAQVLFTNGGQQDLVLSNMSLSGSSDFSIVDTTPASKTASSRDGVTVTLRFSPSAAGVQLGTLTVKSNAENFPTVSLDLVGPAGSNPLADGPQVVPFETSVTASTVEGYPKPVAFVRVFNVGQRSADLDSYSIVNDTDSAFSLMAGIATPGVACGTGNPCGAGKACGSDSTCPPVVLGSDAFVSLPVLYTSPGSGTHTATVRTVAEDPQSASPTPQNIDVTVSGTD